MTPFYYSGVMGRTPNVTTGQIQIPLPNLPGLDMVVVSSDAVVTLNATGTGDGFTKSGSNIILTDSAASFVANQVGTYVTINGATTPANNGRFLITARTATTLTYVNASGVTEAYSGVYDLHGRASQVTDRVAGRVFTNGTVTSQPPMKPLPENNSKLVIGRGTAITNLSYSGFDDTNYNSNDLCSFGIYLGSENGIPTGSPDLFSLSDSISTYANSQRFRINWATGDMIAIRTASSTSTTVTMSAIGGVTPVMMGFTLQPGGTDSWKWYFSEYNGGGDINLGSFDISPRRLPTLQSIATLMGTVTGGNGMHVLGWCLAANPSGPAGTWGLTHFVQMRQWFDQYFYT